jgi:ribose-phosphate pyrophosphokinase
VSYLVIDSDNYGEHGIETFMFPGGEPHVKIPELADKSILLYLKLRTWEDVGYAVMLLDALAEQFEQRLVVADESPRRRVFIPYFPGGRQDRSDGNSPLTLRMMALMLTRSETTVFDPHSKSTVNWVNKMEEVLSGTTTGVARSLMPSDLDLSTLPYYKGVIAPDEGAKFRALDFAARLPGKPEVFECKKTRDFATGRITGYEVPALAPGHYLVVDDICDGGATFNMLADSVKQTGEHQRVYLDLWVSHGIFSRGLDELRKRYGRIYTTDSFYKSGSYAQLDHSALDGNPGVTTFSLKQLFDKIMES